MEKTYKGKDGMTYSEHHTVTKGSTLVVVSLEKRVARLLSRWKKTGFKSDLPALLGRTFKKASAVRGGKVYSIVGHTKVVECTGRVARKDFEDYMRFLNNSVKRSNCVGFLCGPSSLKLAGGKTIILSYPLILAGVHIPEYKDE